MTPKNSKDNDVVIKVDHVSKKFSKSLKKSMIYGMEEVIKNSIGIKTRSNTLRNTEFWALDDVSFEVKKGECLGIIGPNGSGKTTLLSLLNGIFWPDRGKITVKGRVGALIAVGAGFHPLLTGRENIYLNAAILGMSKRDVEDRFDDIVKFADIGNFLDTPVKNYSSGMFVRLGFAVAVYCKPDILLVDEVLSVGDIAFQAHCFKKINELEDMGTTIVLVSHNLERIMQYSDRAIFLKDGRVVFEGDTRKACNQYLQNSVEEQKITTNRVIETLTSGIKIAASSGITDINFKMVDSQGNEKTRILSDEEIYLQFSFYLPDKTDCLQVGVIIYNNEGLYLTAMDTLADGLKIRANSGFVEGILKIKRANLAPGRYSAVLAITNRAELMFRGHSVDFIVLSKKSFQAGFIELSHEWQLKGNT